MEMSCFNTDLKNNIQITYNGEGMKIAHEFYIPILKISQKYDRLSGYFSIESLVITATGIAGLINNGGKMRLVLGAHDFGPELVKAYELSKDHAKELIEKIGERIAKKLESVEDVISKSRLEALAWMIAEKKLEIKIAVPKKAYLGSNQGIFHEKLLVFQDNNGCIISAHGSTNETRAAWETNGESLTAFLSWKNGSQEYIKRHNEQFDLIWNNNNNDYHTLSLPKALEEKISQRFYRPQNQPRFDVFEEILPTSNINNLQKLIPLASFVLHLGNVKGLNHLGLGPVSLYPHQTYTMEEALRRFPFRILLADEVGLGKTLEAGAIIKRILDTNKNSRICILTPKNVSRQWLDEMWSRFGLNFSLLVTNPKRFLTADEREIKILDDENPFDKPGCDLIIASWHYARGTRNRDQEILNTTKFFDLVVIDEAHAARRRWSQEPPTPTKLKSLADELASTSPHIILMSATPVQLDEREALDLLEILGLGGRWVHPNNFLRYYDIIKKKESVIDLTEWYFALDLATYVSSNYLKEKEVEGLVKGIFQFPLFTESNHNRLVKYLKGGTMDSEIKSMLFKNPEKFKKLLVSLNPMNWFMIRNTRENLTKIGYNFPHRNIEHVNVNLNLSEQILLEDLDEYLFNYYGMIEKMLTENKGVIGFVRTIYHQRFVSSFASSYKTVSNRVEFLESLLRKDKEKMKIIWEKILSDEEVDIDEENENFIDELQQEIEIQRDVIKKEIEYLEKLKDKLKYYSTEFMSKDDPKLIKVFNVVNIKINKENKKVLVFSKYTDTIDAIRKFLTNKKNLEHSRIGLYTGDGGKLYDVYKKSYIKCSKEEVRSALDNGKIDLLLCSEAASEGLNLQSASVVINVDMPWNPAKVEQRIGRIDRLGQNSKEVEVINIWYPKSIEARMYRMLFERKEIYKLVVGPAQEIVSANFKRSMERRISDFGMEKIVKDVQKEIEEIKKKIKEREEIIEGLSYKKMDKIYDDNKVIRLVAEFLTMALDAHGISYSKIENIDGKKYLHIDLPDKYKELEQWNDASLEIGRANTLTPAHPIVNVFAKTVVELAVDQNVSKMSVYMLEDFEGLSDLIVKGMDETMTMDRKNGKEALEVFEKLIRSVQNE